MLRTAVNLKNQEQIENLMQQIVKESYDEVVEDGYLLCMECGDVDLYIAAAHNEELQDAINANFETDECGDIIEYTKHQQLMDDLYDYFIELHKNSGYFDFFPSGFYEIKGENRKSETDMLAPKGLYYAPFEDAKREA